jgi:hypothetical protein
VGREGREDTDMEGAVRDAVSNETSDEMLMQKHSKQNTPTSAQTCSRAMPSSFARRSTSARHSRRHCSSAIATAAATAAAVAACS